MVSDRSLLPTSAYGGWIFPDGTTVFGHAGCTIGVKTASGIGIIDLADPRKNPPARSKFFRQEHVRLFPRHEFDGLMPIHFCLSPFDNSKIKSPQALVVDELGGLWATDSVRSMRKIAAGQTPHRSVGVEESNLKESHKLSQKGA